MIKSSMQHAMYIYHQKTQAVCSVSPSTVKIALPTTHANTLVQSSTLPRRHGAKDEFVRQNAATL